MKLRFNAPAPASPSSLLHIHDAMDSAQGLFGYPRTSLDFRRKPCAVLANASANSCRIKHAQHPDLQRCVCYPGVPQAPGEDDPAISLHGSAMAQQYAAVPLAIGPAPRNFNYDSDIGRVDRKVMEPFGQPRFALAGRLADAEVAFDTKYEQLVLGLQAKVQLAFSDPHRSVYIYNVTGPGVQHVYVHHLFYDQSSGEIGIPWKRFVLQKDPLVNELRTVVENYLAPFVSQRFFGGRRAVIGRAVISRNVKVVAESVRTRAMLWHWDSLDDDMIKVILYLSDVPDARSGCMQAMVHNHTRHPAKIRNLKLEAARRFGKKNQMTRQLWGSGISPVSLPRPWYADLFRLGYVPRCLGGPVGTAVMFDTNIVHRGARPSTGAHRDGVLLELIPDATQRAMPTNGAAESNQALSGQRNSRQQANERQLLPEHSAVCTSGIPVAAEKIYEHQQLEVQQGEPTVAIHESQGRMRKMPMLGFGTANRKTAGGPALIRSTLSYLRLGGRVIDTAQMYGNYREIGSAIAASQVAREEIFVISKVHPSAGKKGFVTTAAGARAAVVDCLQQLNVAYLDAMLIHVPWALSSKELEQVWLGLIESRAAGLVRSIGVSNFNRAQIENLVNATHVWPAINEIEYHPWVSAYTQELVRWCRDRGIVIIAYGSLGSSHNRNHSSSAIADVSRKHQASAVQVLLSYALYRGVAVIPGATSQQHISENLCARNVKIDEEDARAIEGSKKPKRFMQWKGLCEEQPHTDPMARQPCSKV